MTKKLSVTKVIPKPDAFDLIDPDVLDAACMKGIQVHGKLKWYALQLMNPSLFFPMPVLSPTENLYFKSGAFWLDKYIDKIIYVEKEFYHPLYKYYLHPDLVAILKGDILPSVIDFKTPIQYQKKEWSAQLAAYKFGIEADGIMKSEHGYDMIDKGYSVRVKANGKSPLVNQTNDINTAFQGFLNALGSYRYFKT